MLATSFTLRRKPIEESRALEAFESGDYTTAALEAASDEMRGAALVMLGHHEEGMPLLERLKTPRALFYSGFGFWGLGEDAEAARRLRRVPTDSDCGGLAQKLLPYVEGRKFRVLLQGRDNAGCPDYDFVGAVRKSSRFDVKSIGFPSTSDVVIDHTTTYEQMMARLPHGWHPDFFLNQLVEDNPPPIGMERAAFPTICHPQDHDRHFHHCNHYLQLFDAVITLGRADHQSMGQMTQARVFVFPKVLGVSVQSGTELDRPREYDICVTGMLFLHTRRKGRHLIDISQLPSRYKVRLIDGYANTGDYYDLLRSAKVTFTFVNRCGLINGRAVEAISQGTCAVYQAGGELGLFLKESDGAIPYEPDNAMATLTRAVDQWDERYRAAGLRGASKVATLFDIQTCMQRYLHFAALVALRGVRRGRRPVDPNYAQIRYPNRSPLRTMFHFDESLDKMFQLQAGFRQAHATADTYERVDAYAESSVYTYLLARGRKLPPAPRDGVYPAFSKLLLPASIKLNRTPAGKAWFERMACCIPYRGRLRHDAKAALFAEELDGFLIAARDRYRLLIEKYPNRIAARFNLARVLYEMRDEAAARGEFQRVLDDPSLVYQANDLLFWREFNDAYFDYELMMEECVAYACDRDQRHLWAVERAIRESSRLYLSLLWERAGNMQAARDVLAAAPQSGWQFPAVTLALARIESKLGNFTESERHYHAAFESERVLLTRVSLEELEGLARHCPDVDDLVGKRLLLRERCPKITPQW